VFTGFNLSLTPAALALVAKDVKLRLRTAIPVDHRARVRKALDDLLDPAGTLDVSRMTADWFPDVACDVFLSHAHADAGLARDLAGFLSDRFDLRTFIDADLWGSIADLQRRVDDRSRGAGAPFDYDDVLASSAHVHMILMSALSKMMDRCECLVFLNSPRSVPVATATRAGTASSTYSPWIYAEILLSSLIRRRLPQAHRPVFKVVALREYAAPKFRYELPLAHLRALDEKDLGRWKTEAPVDARYPALDWLYATFVPDQLPA
jgi:hypothetical protein